LPWFTILHVLQHSIISSRLLFSSRKIVDEWSIVISTRSCRQAFVPRA
jgi:hypothetical protein